MQTLLESLISKIALYNFIKELQMKYKYHYTYRITNITKVALRIYYYGVRSTNLNPKDDLGIIYFSTSTNKEFIKDQKENPQNYKYKVIKTFKTRKEAISLEIKLHDKFNVGVNEIFYNKAKQTSTGFDITDNAEIAKKIGDSLRGIKKSQAHCCAIRQSLEDIPENIKKYKNNNHSILMTGKIQTNESNLKRSIALKGIKKSEEAKMNMSIASTGIKHSKYRRKMNSEAQKGKILTLQHKINIGKGRIGIGCLKINIYNNNNVLIYVCDENFKMFCQKNGLPYDSLYKSYHNNERLYNTKQKLSFAKKVGFEIFKDWYAEAI